MYNQSLFILVSDTIVTACILVVIHYRKEHRKLIIIMHYNACAIISYTYVKTAASSVYRLCKQ